MKTFDLDLKSIKSIAVTLQNDLDLVNCQISQLTEHESHEGFVLLNDLRLERCITTSVLHDVQSRMKIGKARIYEKKFVSVANALYPHSKVTSIPTEFKPDADPTSEILMIEQTRIFTYEKLNSAGRSSSRAEEAIGLIPLPATENDIGQLADLRHKNGKALKYFNIQSIRIIRARKRLYQLYSRLPDRKIYMLTVAKLTAEEHLAVEAKSSFKPYLRKRIKS